MDKQLVTSFEQVNEVNPKNLEQEIRRVWQSAAKADQQVTKDMHSRIKATLSNIIILVRANDNIDNQKKIDEIITSLSITHPSRFFVVEYDERLEKNIQTGVSSRCVLAHSGSRVCSEELFCKVNGVGAKSVANLLMSLLIPEVPVLLLTFIDFGAEVVEKRHYHEDAIDLLELFSRISQYSQRICYDSNYFSNYCESTTFVSRSVPIYNGENSPWSDFILSGNGRDLSWQRVRRWRYLIAEQFDSSICQEPREDIKNIKISFISHVGDLKAGNIPGEPLLLIAWIVDKLGFIINDALWVEQESVWQLIFHNKVKDEVRICFGLSSFGSQEQTYQGAISDIVFQVTDSFSNLHEISLVRKFASGIAELQTRALECLSERHPVCEFSVRKIPFKDQSTAELVFAEINSGARSRNFGPAYKYAFEIIETIKTRQK